MRARQTTHRRRKIELAAAAALVACLLLPVQAGAQEAAGSPLAAPFDLVILRPLGLAATVVGAGLFVPAAAVSLTGGWDNVREAWELFVGNPAESVFSRRLGDF